MKKIVLAFLLCLAMTSLLGAAEKPSEESLFKAWEQIQKTDPSTVIFEKIEDHRYKFKTTLFPFDGELKVNDLTIDDTAMMGYNNNFTVGLLDVELVGLSKDITQKYSRKYSMWTRSNMIYYDKKAGKWLSPQEFQVEIAKMSKEMSSPLWGLYSNYVLLAVLLLALVYLFILMQKNRQAVKTALERQADSIAKVDKSIALSEKGIQLGEEANKLLKEMLDVLKDKR